MPTHTHGGEGGGVSYELILGDCLQIMKGMADKSVDLIVADPPYNVSVKGGNLENILSTKKHAGKAAGRRDFGEWDYGYSPTETIAEMDRLLSACGQVYIFTLSELIGEWITGLKQSFEGVKIIDWIKPDPVPSVRQRHWCSANEFIVWAWRGKHTFNYLGHSQMYTWQMYQAPKTIERVHPNQKPVPLLKKLVTVSSNPGDIVLDPFCGSGSTGVACIKSGRNFVGIEKDEHYFEIGKKRLADAAAQPLLLQVNQ